VHDGALALAGARVAGLDVREEGGALGEPAARGVRHDQLRGAVGAERLQPRDGAQRPDRSR